MSNVTWDRLSQGLVSPFRFQAFSGGGTSVKRMSHWHDPAECDLTKLLSVLFLTSRAGGFISSSLAESKQTVVSIERVFPTTSKDFCFKKVGVFASSFWPLFAESSWLEVPHRQRHRLSHPRLLYSRAVQAKHCLDPFPSQSQQWQPLAGVR